MSTPSRGDAASATDVTPADDDLSGPDETTLVVRAQHGDIGAFEVLVDRYQGPIFRLVLRMLGDRAEAEDVTQETMIATWRRLDQLREPDRFRSWLFRAATRRCVDIVRRRQRQSTDSLDAEQATERTLLDTTADRSVPGTERQAVGNAQWHALATLVQSLPPVQRACWLLRELDGFSYAEIAGIVRTTEAGVRGQLARARATLAKGMAAWR